LVDAQQQLEAVIGITFGLLSFPRFTGADAYQ